MGCFYSNVGQVSFCKVYVLDLFIIDQNAQNFHRVQSRKYIYTPLAFCLHLVCSRYVLEGCSWA